MRRALFLGFWLLAAVGLAASSQGGLVVHALFRLQQEHIAEHHCEERDDPDSDCDGFCFLKKRLAEADAHSWSYPGSVDVSSLEPSTGG